MTQKILLIILIHIISSNLEIICQNNQTVTIEQQLKDEVAYKKRELKRYNLDLKSLRINNAPKKQIAEMEAKIQNGKKELNQLKKRQKTSNKFNLATPDLAEDRGLFDHPHSQDFYNAKEHGVPASPSNNHSDKIHNFFRTH